MICKVKETRDKLIQKQKEEENESLFALQEKDLNLSEKIPLIEKRNIQNKENRNSLNKRNLKPAKSLPIPELNSPKELKGSLVGTVKGNIKIREEKVLIFFFIINL